MQESITRFSKSGNILGKPQSGFNNFLADYGDFGAMQRIGYVNIATNGAGVAFSNIPQTYQDLFLVVKAGGYSSGSNAYPYDLTLSYNGDGTTTNYSFTRLTGNGTSATSDRGTQYNILGKYAGNTGTTGNYYSTAVIHIMNYASTTTYKPAISRWTNDQGTNDTNGQVGLCATTWKTTAAISSIQVAGIGLIGSTAELFGIKASNS